MAPSPLQQGGSGGQGACAAAWGRGCRNMPSRTATRPARPPTFTTPGWEKSFLARPWTVLAEVTRALLFGRLGGTGSDACRGSQSPGGGGSAVSRRSLPCCLVPGPVRAL